MPSHPAARAALSYTAAAAIIWWLLRGVDLTELAKNLSGADLRVFLPVVLATFLCWFFGENLLYSRLFSYFHAEISFVEMLPVNSVFYSLQIVNGGVGAGAMVLMLHKRKGVSWLEGGFAMIFQGFIDFQLQLLMTLAAGLWIGAAPLGLNLAAVGAAALAWWLPVSFWLRGRPALEAARRLYDWAPMACFRKAGLRHYLVLMAIRAPMFLMQGLSLYLALRSFGVRAPLGTVLAVNPAIILLKSLPFAPLGLGSEQAGIVYGLRAFAPKETLLAMSLSASALNVLFRLVVAALAAPAVLGFKPPKS